MVDDTSDYIPDFYQGNLQAKYPAGATGIALAEQADATGRVWWFVVMQSMPIDEKAAPGPQAWQAGWMSSRFVTPLPALPTGRADNQVQHMEDGS
jgi:hypothetical protein